MNIIQRSGPTAWQTFTRLLQEAPGIRPAAFPHYARWVGLWREAGGQASPQATRTVFENLGRRPGVADWQFRQAVHAVRLWATRISGAVWAESFDWDGLAAQDRDLEPHHQTLLRETQPVAARAPEWKAELPAESSARSRISHRFRRETPRGLVLARHAPNCLQRLCVNTLSKGNSSATLPEHAAASRSRKSVRNVGQDREPAPGEDDVMSETLEDLRRAIRLAGLAVATETTYAGWTCRKTGKAGNTGW